MLGFFGCSYVGTVSFVWNCADDKASVELELYVNKTTAPGLNTGKDRLDDIVVLHLQGGKDLFVSLCCSSLDNRVVERLTRDREVAGSSLIHCTVEYGPAQAAHTHLPLWPSGKPIIWYWWKGGDVHRRSGVALAMRHRPPVRPET